jgi:hypothetical protein
LKDTNHKLDYTCKKLNIAVEKRVPDTDNKNKLEDLILLKSLNKKASYTYYAIRAQTDYANTKAKAKNMILAKAKLLPISTPLELISTDQTKALQYKEIYSIKNVANSVNI